MLSLTEYDELATKFIKKYGKDWMFEPEYFGILVHFLIKADMKYIETKSSLSTYRVGAWLIAKKHLFSLRKRNTSSLPINESTLESLYGPESDYQPEDGKDVVAIINNPILTKKQREVMLLRFKEGLKLREIAEVFKTTPQDINICIKRGISKLRRSYGTEKVEEVNNI